MKVESISDIDDLLIAHTADGKDCCEKCCFKDYKQACYRMICQDNFRNSVYWTLKGVTGATKIPFIWPDYARECRDLKGLCRSKIAEVYKTR